MRSIQFHSFSVATGAVIATLLSVLLSMQGVLTPRNIPTLTAAEKEMLGHMSIVLLDDGTGQFANKTIRFTGVNVQVVNGLGATNGYPVNPDSLLVFETQVNGVGNLIVGYNELDHPLPNFTEDRTGSHNVVFGHGNSYSSFGGIVGSWDSQILSPFASVLGGRYNRATALGAVVSGGLSGTASGCMSSVSGGWRNEAISSTSTVSGGQDNMSLGYSSSVSGGDSRSASGSTEWRAGSLSESN